MANGFGSFYVGNSGLRNSQNALNTTANNLANVNTRGYVREQVRFSDLGYLTRNNPTSGTKHPTVRTGCDGIRRCSRQRYFLRQIV